MSVLSPAFTKTPRPSFSKPNPGTPINWGHPFAQGLVFSLPINEGRGKFCREYANENGWNSLGWGVGTGSATLSTDPVWDSVDKVLCLNSNDAVATSNGPVLGSAYGFQVGSDVGYNNSPAIDLTKGFTVHTWAGLQSNASLNQDLFSIGNANDVGSFLQLIPGTIFGSWRLNIELQGRTPSTINTATYGSSVTDFPNQFVCSYTVVDSNNWGLKVWDTFGSLIVDTSGTGPLPSYSGYNTGTIYFGGTGSNGGYGRYALYACNIWNYPLGEVAAKAVMQNPLGMYFPNDQGGTLSMLVGDDLHDLPDVTISADPDAIIEGYPSTLSWDSSFSDVLTIDNGIGSVTVPNGSMVVFPTVTTTYTITATNDFGSASAQVTITVTPRGSGRPPGVSAGAILQRDLTMTTDAALGPTDDGTPFDAFVTIGSVVLCHPSELAMVLFLTTEAKAIGSHPDISVILDEIEESIAVPFVSLGAFVADPPVLVAQQTLYSDRFYISQTRQPAVCRHMQVKVTWPAEAAANELLSWSVIGAHTEER